MLNLLRLPLPSLSYLLNISSRNSRSGNDDDLNLEAETEGVNANLARDIV